MKSLMVKRFTLMGILLGMILAVGTTGFTLLEGMTPLDALYFSVATVATVGYGDLHPVTPAGRMLAVFVILTGVGTFLYVVANGTELLMERRQEEVRRQKLNMVIGLFFSEIGFDLLRLLVEADSECGDVRSAFGVKIEWGEAQFHNAEIKLKSLCMRMNPENLDLAGLRDFLRLKSDLLLRILENQNLSEHEEFTNLLQALFHFKVELIERKSFSNLPETDLKHLGKDAERIYAPLVKHWLGHLRHLKAEYPYLYSLAVRTNPFNPEAEVVITE